MVNVPQVVVSLLASESALRSSSAKSDLKTIAVVGAGSAGLAALRAFLDLPNNTRHDWSITLFEQRRDVGGIWLPDPQPESPPQLPETPLYPQLMTNTPVPLMTYPNFPFPAGTLLYPTHPHIEQYHRDYARAFDLYPHIQFNRTVESANWVGDPSLGQWNTTICDPDRVCEQTLFHHLIVATGNNHWPHVPTWKGQEQWLDDQKRRFKREILHSIWYRTPNKYLNRTVIVVGSGGSGSDAASQIAPLAHKTYHSVRNVSQAHPSAILKPEISHFTTDAVVFIDGTNASDVDAIILGTGYEVRVPFLEKGQAVHVDPLADSNTSYTHGLFTNLRYMFPLHQHIFSLCPSYPTNALAFIGLPSYVANCPSDLAQSLYAIHSIVNSTVLQRRDVLLNQLAAEEAKLRSLGYDPYRIGHRMLPLNGTQWEYQDRLVAYLKEKGTIANDKMPFVESWRRGYRPHLRAAWKRVEEEGTEEQWLKGVETEEEWAALMDRLNDWQHRWETDRH